LGAYPNNINPYTKKEKEEEKLFRKITIFVAAFWLVRHFSEAEISHAKFYQPSFFP
jgi:hypothetical protein